MFETDVYSSAVSVVCFLLAFFKLFVIGLKLFPDFAFLPCRLGGATDLIRLSSFWILSILAYTEAAIAFCARRLPSEANISPRSAGEEVILATSSSAIPGSSREGSQSICHLRFSFTNVAGHIELELPQFLRSRCSI